MPYHCAIFQMGLAGPGPVCVASTTAVITEGAARVASVPNICVRPTTTPHNMGETCQMPGASTTDWLTTWALWIPPYADILKDHVSLFLFFPF